MPLFKEGNPFIEVTFNLLKKKISIVFLASIVL